MEELPDIVQTLKKQLTRIFALCNIVLFPITYIVLIIQMDFRVISRTVFSISFWCLFLLMDAVMIVMYFMISRPIRLFADEWKSKEGNLEPETYEYYWSLLTRLPFKMGVWIALLVTLILSSGSMAFHLIGLYDLRQSAMMFFAALWLGLFSGMALYARTKDTLNPALALIHSQRPLPWGGRKIRFAYKMIAIAVIISIFPLIEVSLQVERWTNESVKKLYRDAIMSDIEDRAAILRKTWTPSGPPPDFIQGSDRYFIAAANRARDNAANLLVKKWEIPLPQYFTVPISDGYVLGRNVRAEEWKPYTRKVRFTVILFLVVFSLFALLVGYIFGQTQGGSTSRMTELARDIAHGQAFRYQHLISYSDDEEGELSEAFNEVLGVVRKQFGVTESLIERIREAVSVLGSSSSEMRAVADRQADDAHQQAGRVGDIAGAGAQIAAAAAEITNKSTGVKEAAESTLEACREGIKRIENAVRQIGEANQRAEEMVERMNGLEKRFEEIGKVAETIAGVSDRTELISMNASLEAAGARRHGTRFGVVAAEVKRLAVMIGDMTVDIRNHITALRNAIQETARATRDSAAAVEEGVKGVSGVHTNLDQLSRTAEKTYTAAIEINISTREQTTASERLADTLNEISELAKQVAESSEESRKAIEDISQIALSLNDILWSTKH